MWYEGAGTSDRRWLQADEKGSVIAVSDASGARLAINRYDEFGIPQAGNSGRFQYTGQTWLGELGLYNYKARFYSPTLGRFMQTDPIGYGDGLNWYNYVGGDPVNARDPSGLMESPGVGCQPNDYRCQEYDNSLISDPNIITVIACGGGAALFRGVCYEGGLNTDGPDFIDNPGVAASGGSSAPGTTGPTAAQPQSDEDYCAGYEAFATARTAVGTAGDGAGALEDILSRTPAAVIPQAQGLMKGLKLIEGVGLGGSAAIGLYMGYRYGDWNAFAESAGGALAGGVLAASYKRIANIVEPSRNNDLVADLIANAVPQGVNIRSSGRCAQ